MKPILKDLCVLIRKTTIHYNETCEQKDVVLTEEFQQRFGDYLRNKNYTIDFYRYTAVISTSVGNYMFVPNQWFVIASYAIGVYTELLAYKNHLLSVCEYMGERPKIFIPKLRDETSTINKELFFEGCEVVFEGNTRENIEIAKQRLWRFATDYSWWSGNKTVDRGDFYLSVILNMLSLVNASQSYVAEIVSDYYKAGLAPLVSDLSNFTETAKGATYEINDYRDPKEYIPETEVETFAQSTDSEDEIVIAVRSKQ